MITKEKYIELYNAYVNEQKFEDMLYKYKGITIDHTIDDLMNLAFAELIFIDCEDEHIIDTMCDIMNELTNYNHYERHDVIIKTPEEAYDYAIERIGRDNNEN